MSKELLISERPPDMGPSGGGEPNWGKQSIGNYKGVMLCNRPLEVGAKQVPERQEENRPSSIFIKSGSKGKLRNKSNNEGGPGRAQESIVQGGVTSVNRSWALKKHKEYLKNLKEKKQLEKEDKMMRDLQEEEKFKTLKEKQAKSRQKVRKIKETIKPPVPQDSPNQVTKIKVAKLTKENLEKNEESIKESAQKDKRTKKGRPRPQWATTEKQRAEKEEEEMDALLEFAYELDYEKYIEDVEVQQALAIIQERVSEIKKDEEWRKNIAEKWNQAVEEEEAEEERQNHMEKKSFKDDQGMSIKTGASKRSMRSYAESVRIAKEKAASERPDWDKSTVVGDKKERVEDRVARELVDDMMKQNMNLGKIHSKQSMRKILEKEAKRQLLSEGLDKWGGPRVTVIKDHEMNTDLRPSNLPHLRENPAI